MKKIFSLIALSLFLLTNCTKDFERVVDFTTVVNPNLSEASVVGKPNSAKIWLQGIERQLSITLNEVLILAELGSDNYVNTQTFYSQFLDGLDIRITDPDMRDTQGGIHKIREMAKFGLDKVGPADTEYTDEINAEYNFFEGLSYLYAAMYFSHLPQDPIGPVVASEQNFNDAITSFNKAIELSPKPEYHLASARANYYLGKKSEAVSAANKALSMNSSFLRSAKYDEKDGPSNTMESALYERATFDDFQPLPTLDFLDPKYSFLTPDEDPSVHYLKAEEAYLILAEASISSSDLQGAKGHLKNMLTLISTREIRDIDDSTEGRTQKEADSRPNKSSVIVNGRTGLVLDRQTGKIKVPSVSGTSLTSTAVDALSNEDTALEILYRTRQEVFIAEGLRFADMGIKLVIHDTEISQNSNITEGASGTEAVVPSFINSVKDKLDMFTYSASENTVTITIDINKILVANKAALEVLPFH